MRIGNRIVAEISELYPLIIFDPFSIHLDQITLTLQLRHSKIRLEFWGFLSIEELEKGAKMFNRNLESAGVMFFHGFIMNDTALFADYPCFLLLLATGEGYLRW